VSALAEALVAAQRRALAQLEKEFVRSVQEDADERAGGFRDALTAIGLTDRLDVESLIACLEVLRVTGGALPAEPTNGARSPETEKATDAQLALIARLVKEKAIPELQTPGLPVTKAQAHEIIDTLKAGTYDAEKWAIPF
jgi:hypothetical protein